MKIGIFAPYDLTNKYGNTIRPIQQAESLIKRGLKQTCIYCLKSDSALKIKQVTINKSFLSYIPKKLLPRDTSFIFQLPFIKKINLPSSIDIFQIENYYSILATPKLSNTKLVVDFHAWKSIALKDMTKKMSLFKKIIYFQLIYFIKKIERHAVKRADKIIVASQNVKDCILNDYPKINPNKIIVIHGFFDSKDFPKNRYIQNFSVGVIGPFTDKINNVIPFIIQLSKNTSVPIKIVGKIDKHEEDQLKNCPNISYLGVLKSKKYKKFFEEIGAILLPYENYYRGGGPRNKLLEACATGTPIISTKAGAKGFEHKNELIIANNTKEFVYCINKLKNDVQLRKISGKKLIRIIKTEYNPDKETDKLVRLYEKLKDKNEHFR